MGRLYTLLLSSDELSNVREKTVDPEDDVGESLFLKIDEATILRNEDEATAIVLQTTKEQLKAFHEKLSKLFQRDGSLA